MTQGTITNSMVKEAVRAGIVTTPPANTSTGTSTSTDAITPAEWELMRIVWTEGAIATRDIIALMQRKRDWSESTIKTLLNRLVKKGFLTTERDNRKFIYHPAVAEITAMDNAAGTLFDHLCAMKKGKALINLVQSQEMCQADIRSMITVLERKLATAPETMTCDCLPPDGAQTVPTGKQQQ